MGATEDCRADHPLKCCGPRPAPPVRNFAQAAETAGISRIIYLGALREARTDLSSHLRSRVQVADERPRGTVPVTVTRAAVNIGSGSASYEIIQHLVSTHRVLPVARRANNRCQPTGIRDVVKHLVGVLEIPESSGMIFDIGGADVSTYLDMVKAFANLLNRRVQFVPARWFSNL